MSGKLRPCLSRGEKYMEIMSIQIRARQGDAPLISDRFALTLSLGEADAMKEEKGEGERGSHVKIDIL